MNWRTLTLLLILVNLLYWAWSSWIVQPEIVGLEDHRIADVPLLELVTQTKSSGLNASVVNNVRATEVQEIESITPLITAGVTSTLTDSLAGGQTQAEASSENEQDQLQESLDVSLISDASVPLVCKRIGAFVNESDAEEAATWLETEGIRTQKKIGLDMVWQGYWVYLPKYPNREAAIQVVTELNAKGIKDMFVEIVDPNKNALSLGLYRQRAGAESRARQIKAQGYPAKIGNKEREQAVFWLETQIQQGREIPLQALSAPSGQVRRIEVKDCE